MRRLGMTGRVDLRISVEPCSNCGHVHDWQGVSGGDEEESSGEFRQDDDYRIVHHNGIRFQLGAAQAKIVKLLHEAQQRGDPWVNGKESLHKAGASSARIGDLFKSQKHWRSLIESRRDGFYRLRT